MTGDSHSIAGRFADLRLPNEPHPGNKIRCPHCQQYLKTQSELRCVALVSRSPADGKLRRAPPRKHVNRHTKPFRCEQPGCDRSEGFATVNDRDRHVKSRHPGAVGDGFRCSIGACLAKCKLWPRADNFRQHLKRVHKRTMTDDDDLDQFRYRQVERIPTAKPLRS